MDPKYNHQLAVSVWTGKDQQQVVTYEEATVGTLVEHLGTRWDRGHREASESTLHTPVVLLHRQSPIPQGQSVAGVL